jgi:hypothetical protein
MSEIKAVLLDADGLMFKKQGYFSAIYSEEYGVPAESIIRRSSGSARRGMPT